MTRHSKQTHWSFRVSPKVINPQLPLVPRLHVEKSSNRSAGGITDATRVIVCIENVDNINSNECYYLQLRKLTLPDRAAHVGFCIDNKASRFVSPDTDYANPSHLVSYYSYLLRLLGSWAVNFRNAVSLPYSNHRLLTTCIMSSYSFRIYRSSTTFGERGLGNSHGWKFFGVCSWSLSLSGFESPCRLGIVKLQFPQIP